MRQLLLTSLLLAMHAGPAAAQIIPIRTGPIVRADRFEILPSSHFGIGEASIAYSDTLGDPFVNPAAGTRIGLGSRVFGSPVLYAVSERSGDGSALPLGALHRSGPWFAAGALAIQDVKPARPEGQNFGLVEDGTRGFDAGGPSPPSGSVHGFAALARSWPGRGLSLGASVRAAKRSAVDGNDLLYGASERIESSGTHSEFRLGLVREWSGARSLEAVAVHSRSRMRHDVTYGDVFWDPEAQVNVRDPREERDADHADVWGVQLVHARPLDSRWRIGWLLTGNRVSYPGLPRYDFPKDGIMDIPSGRGSAHAWNVGVGLATGGEAHQTGRRDEANPPDGASPPDRPIRLALDVIFEPIWSRIWSEAEADTETTAGGTIPAGGRTLDNRLRLSSAIVRMGAAREWQLDPEENTIGVHLGVTTRLVDFRLAQFDHLQEAGRDDRERWMEWTPTWGVSLRFGKIDAGYRASVTYGTKRPGAANRGSPACLGFCPLSSTVAPGPWPPRDMSELGRVNVVNQQIFVSFLVGGGSARPGGDEP